MESILFKNSQDISKMKISLIRGAFLNPFELQNYYPLKDKFDIQAISSQHPIDDKVDLPLTKLWSPTDIPDFPYKYPILNRLFTDAQYLYSLERQLQGTDIVHVAETYYHYTIQAIKAKQKGIVKKLVSTCWDTIPHNNEGIRGRREFKDLARKSIDHFLAVTNLAKSALMKEGVEQSRVSVIHMGINTDRFVYRDRNYQNGKRILFIGRNSPEKGLPYLITAFQTLHSKYPDLTLTLVGSGHENQSYSNLPGIEIKQLPYDQIHQEYQNSDMFCLPSVTLKHAREQFGMVLIEAMASGLPIVTTRAGAISEVCGDAVLYAHESSTDSLVTKFENLIKSSNLRKELGQKANKRALSEFDYRKVAIRIDDLYQSLF